jgi:ureidoacrylate peracid hydrolase
MESIMEDDRLQSLSDVLPLKNLGALAGPDRTAVLLVDIQCVFAGLPLQPSVPTVLSNLKTFLESARGFGVPIIVIRNVVPPEVNSPVWKRQFPQLENNWLDYGTPNAEFEPGFEPREGDIVITKPRYSAFFGTQLESILRTLDVRTVVSAGLTTDICVCSTVRDAFQRDLQTITLSDCCAEMTLNRHTSALESIASNFGTVCTSRELLAQWQGNRNMSQAG